MRRTNDCRRMKSALNAVGIDRISLQRQSSRTAGGIYGAGNDKETCETLDKEILVRSQARPKPRRKARSISRGLSSVHSGIRAGWLVLLFYCLFRLFVYIFGAIVYATAPDLVGSEVTPFTALISELVPFLAMIGAGGIMLLVAPSPVRGL